MKGSVYPLGDNFSRWRKPNIVGRMRKFVESGMFKRPKWLTAAERTPPLELHNLHLNTTVVHNPYPSLVNKVLQKYPNLRFQDCFVDGNDWAKGLDRYRDDHPAMQFAAHQLDLINRGFNRSAAFKITEKLFYERRMRLEQEQKIHMALGVAKSARPLFTSGQAYWQSELASKQLQQFRKIRDHIRRLRILYELKSIRKNLRKGKVSPTIALGQGKGKQQQKMLTEEQILRIQSFTETYVKLGPKENAKVAQLLSSILLDDHTIMDPNCYEDLQNGDEIAAKSIEVQDSEIDDLLSKIRTLIMEDDFGSDLPAIGSLLDDDTANNLKKWSRIAAERSPEAKPIGPSGAANVSPQAFYSDPFNEVMQKFSKERNVEDFSAADANISNTATTSDIDSIADKWKRKLMQKITTSGNKKHGELSPVQFVKHYLMQPSTRQSLLSSCHYDSRGQVSPVSLISNFQACLADHLQHALVSSLGGNSPASSRRDADQQLRELTHKLVRHCNAIMQQARAEAAAVDVKTMRPADLDVSTQSVILKLAGRYKGTSMHDAICDLPEEFEFPITMLAEWVERNRQK